jgi:hypothetical protein
MAEFQPTDDNDLFIAEVLVICERVQLAQSDYTLCCGPVARKYSVLTEIIDIFTLVCKVCIHDENVAETDFEHPFETPKGFRPGFGEPCAPPAVGHPETS